MEDQMIARGGRKDGRGKDWKERRGGKGIGTEEERRGL